MAEDDTAQTKLVFDATGAKQGAADFQAAAEQVILSNTQVTAAETKATTAVTQAEATKTAVRRAGAQAARDAAAIQAAAAAAGGDAVVNATARIVTSTSSQAAALDRVAKSFDPFIAAAARAQRQLETLMDISAKGLLPGASTQEIANGAKAMDLMTEATNRLNAAQANQAAGFNVGAAKADLTAKFAPAQASAQAMTTELAQLNQALELGVSIEGGYASAWDRIVAKYDDGAQAAARLVAAQQALIEQSRAAQDAANSQANVNTLTGVQTSPGSVGGVAVSPYKSAAESASVFQQQFDVEDKLAAENARLAATYNPIKTASLAYAASLDEIDLAVNRNIISEQQAQVQRDRITAAFADQAGTAKALGLASDNAAGGMDHLRGNTSGVTREFIVLGHEILIGNWTRLGGSLLVMLEYFDGLRTKIIDFGKALFTTGIGIASLVSAAALAALTGFAIAAENTALRIERLRNALALVRPDFTAMSAVAEQASRQLAATTFLSTADSRLGAAAVAGNPGFQGTANQAAQIALAFATLSKSLGETTIDWKRLSDAMVDPAAMLQTLHDQNHLIGVTQALIDQAKSLQAAGDKAGAFALVLKSVLDATAGAPGRMTPLETALHHLSLAFADTSGGGHGFVQSLGQAVDNIAGRIVNGVANIIDALSKAGHWIDQHFPNLPGSQFYQLPAGMVPTTSYGGVQGGINFAPGTPRTGAIPNDVSTQIYDTAERLGMRAELADFATRIAEIESGGHQFSKGGGVLTSSAGALGVMQVMPKSAPVGLDLANQQQNIEAGLKILMDLDRQFGGDFSKIAVGYNAGPGRVGSALPLETQNYLAKLGLGSPPASQQLGAIINPEGGPTSGYGAGGSPSTSGFVNQSNATTDEAKKTADAMGLVSTAAQAAQDKITLFQKALALDPGNKVFVEGLQKAQLELYNAVPALAAAGRAMDMQTQGSLNAAAAWDKDAKAASDATITLKARTEAIQFAAPGTAAYAAAVAILTTKLTAQAAAEQAVTAAQQRSGLRDQIAYTQKEIATLGMDAVSRDVLLARMKAEQDLRRANPQLTQDEIDKTLALVEANTRAADSYKLHEAAINELANTATQAFDTLGNAVSDLLTGKAVDWQSISQQIVKQIINEFLKLAVIAPIMNSLFGQNNPTLGNLFSGIPGGVTGGGAGALGSDANGIAGVLSRLGSSFTNITGLGTYLGLGSGAADAAGLLPAATGASFQVASDLAVTGSTAGQALAGTFHSGGIVGFDAVPGRYVHPAYFDSAPRFHAGLGGDEFAAILQKGERVLTERQQGQVAAAMKGDKAPVGHTFNFNFPATTQPDSFKAAGGHVARQVAGVLARASGRSS